MTAHCATCSCESDAIAQPATSSAWARRAAIAAAREAVARAKQRTTPAPTEDTE